MVIDNIEIDPTNTEFNYASEFVLHTNKLVYLTGKAGTGKTTFLKYLRETVSKNMVILAPTGVAAINAGGQTIHSFFNIKPSLYPPIDKRLREKANMEDMDKSNIYNYFQYTNEKLRIIQGLDLMIIDEISMVRCDLLDLVDRLLRVFRKRRNEPFGGVQVILIGDTFQLSPIVKDQDKEILQQFYKSPFFFSANVIQKNKPVYIELKKIYRQTEQEFIDLLNKVRINQIAAEDIKQINSRYNPSFTPKGNENYIILATHNRIVDRTNSLKLDELKTELHHFESIVIGDFPEKDMPTDRILSLKEGAQVMFIKNDQDKRYYNGKIAKVKSIQDDEITVETSEGNCFLLEKQVWKNYKYAWNEKEKRIEEEFIGSFTQFPLKLAWAITVHKSQGLTFEHVIADLGSAFAPGQVYVALSRCKTFNGLQLKTKIDQSVIKTDERVLEFAKNEMPNTLMIQELNSGKADFYYKKVLEAIKNQAFEEAYVNLLMAIKLRNDFETDLFKRLFIIFASKLGLFKSRY
jgi:ATP-dependent exoDNAse (exonuclease V) alpha subunit